jgi:hypothetical protein
MRIQVTTSFILRDEKEQQVWHWMRLDDNGVLLDGSGPQRYGHADLEKLKRELKKRYPEDVVEGLGE